jgi:hypothetical protein
MEPTCTAPSTRSDLSSGMSRANNVDWNFTTADYMLNRAPDFFVYLFNIAKQEYKVSRLPFLREMVIPARKEGEKYAKVTKLPSPVKLPKGNIDSNEIDIVVLDGRRLAMDIIHPDNFSLNQDAVITQSDSVGQNLGQLGVFWSLNEVPTEKELADATRRMETKYRSLLVEARTCETSNAAMLPAVLTPAHFSAADYFHETFTWHKKEVHMENCPRCGSPANVGAPFHPMEGGGLCVGDWKAAIKAGVRSRAQAYEATESEEFAPRVPVAPAPASHAPAHVPAPATHVPHETK